MINQLRNCTTNPTDRRLDCIISLIKKGSNTEIDYTCILESICAQLAQLNNTVSDIDTAIHTVIPTIVQLEYPDTQAERVVYHYSGLLSSIVGDILVIFRGLPFGDYETLPVYLADDSGYEHILTNGSGDEPQLLGSEIIVNTQIEATYVGNYVHLTL